MKKHYLFVVALLFVIALSTSQGFGQSTGTSEISTGQTLIVTITSPEDGSAVVVPPGNQTIDGVVSIGSGKGGNVINVVYVIDVSGSTMGGFNDINGDHLVNNLDDINRDGKAGTILDAEIAGVIALNESLGNPVNVNVSVVAFGNSAAGADMSPIPGKQFFTTPQADIDGNKINDLEEVVKGLREGSLGEFRPKGVGGGTDFHSALKFMNLEFENVTTVGVSVGFFLSDGFDGSGLIPDTSTILKDTIALGVTVHTFAVGDKSDQSQIGKLAKIAKNTGGSFTVVNDPTELTTALPTTQVVGIKDVVVNGSSVELSPIGTFRKQLTGLILGSNPVEVTATADDGTVATAKITIDGVDELVADFEANPRDGMEPLTVNFTNLSDSAVTSFLWNFGDGTSSPDENPTHVYNAPGLYNVSLTISGVGDSDTLSISDYIHVIKRPTVIADFESDVTEGDAPLAVKFASTSTSTETISSYVWDFGDGEDGSAEINPAHTYQIPGLYTVALTIESGGEIDLENKPEYISVTSPSITADFTADPLRGFAPLNVTFIDRSTGDEVTAWNWDFGDGETSTEQDPVHTYSTSGLFTIILTASNSLSSDTAEKQGFINSFETGFPIANFAADPTSGLTPLLVEFIDLSTGAVTSWAWEFGDGNSSSTQNPSNEYKVAGIYTVSLTVGGPEGSSKEIKTNLINVIQAPPLVTDFTANPNAGFPPLNVNFTDLTAGEPSSWAWKFGTGGFSSEQNPSHEYLIEGFFTVTLTTSNAGGADSETKINIVKVLSQGVPNADFSATPTAGIVPLTVKFTDLSQPADSISNWNWDFGDGGLSKDRNDEHNYRTAGFFTVSLKVSNSTGSDIKRKTNMINVEVLPVPKAEFSATPTVGEPPFAVLFTDLSEPEGEIDSWNWDFGDGGSSTRQNPLHSYNKAGIFTVSLKVSNEGGVGTEIKLNLIESILPPVPVAEFEATPTSGLTPLTVEFKDISEPVDEIDSWIWEFGDGGQSTDQNPTHTYIKGGNMSVKLTVSNKAGADTEIKTNLINVKNKKAIQAALLLFLKKLKDRGQGE